jgi:hypothetical protein
MGAVMRALLAPATATDRGYARELWAALDVLYGYPRAHAADEPGVQIRRGGSPPYTETLFVAYIHDDTGAAALHGVVALVVDDPPAGMLRRRITRGATTRTLGEWIDWLVTNRGWAIMTSLPGQVEAWTQLAVRDGAAGSSTGVPIPEGEE